MRILVVTHDATLSGAPRVALLVTRLMVGAGHDVQVLSRTPGPMLSQFATEAPTSVEVAHRWRARLWRRTPRWFALSVDATFATLTLLVRRPDLVYVNSTSAAIYARAAQWTRRPSTVLHVHESGVNTEIFLRRAGLRDPGSGISLVACSPSVHRELAGLLARPDSEIAMLPSVPDSEHVRQQAGKSTPQEYRDEGLIVGCCGSAEHRKGVDLWITAAARVKDSMPYLDLRFVWVGDSDDLEGVHTRPVEFLGSTDNPYPHLRRFDLLVLPSRDDPFPLVVLEAMLLGTPVVAFDVGAVREQVGDAGVMVPAEDIDALAAAVSRLVADDRERRRLGVASEQRAIAHFSTGAFARALNSVIDARHAGRASRRGLPARTRA